MLLAVAHSSHLSALQSPLSSVSGPEKLQLCPLPPRFAWAGVGGVRREVGEKDGKQVVFNQSGRETGCHQGPFVGVMKVASMPSGTGYLLSSFQWQRVGAGEGNCAWLWVSSVANKAVSTSSGSH